MTVETFTKAQFEAALPVHKTTQQPLWQLTGLVDGEFEYRMPVDVLSAIVIRSSIHSNGLSAESGEDSIRAWLVNNDGEPLGSKTQRWVTRVTGWQDRTVAMLRKLWQLRKTAGNCYCGKPKQIFKVKKEGPNKGRLFACCDEHKNSWTWLGEVE